MRPAERFPALEGVRGYAALLVFFVHAFGYLAGRLHGVEMDRYSLWDDDDAGRILLALLTRSHYGVDLFFVLSGMFMADLAVRRWPGAASFLAGRGLRIYPAYAVSTAAVAAFSAAWFGRTHAVGDLVSNAVFLQGFFPLGIPAINPVTWSLTYEVAFYLSVPLLATAMAGFASPAPRHVLALLAAFAAILAVAALVPAPGAIHLAYFALFVPGVGLGLLGDAGRRQLAGRVPAVAAIGFWVAFAAAVKLEALSNATPAYYAISGAAGGLLVLKACDSPSRLAGLLSGAVPRWLGRYSYSFFLIHYLVVQFWGAVTMPMAAAWDGTAYAIVFVGGSLALSLVAARGLFAVTERYYFRARAR
jgi:peptidoglycan/LPS O-acetylase OafA/YrhL